MMSHPLPQLIFLYFSTRLGLGLVLGVIHIETITFGKGLATSPYAYRCAIDYPLKRAFVLSMITNLSVFLTCTLHGYVHG